MALLVLTEVTDVVEVASCVFAVHLGVLCVVAEVRLLPELRLQLLLQPQAVLVLLAKSRYLAVDVMQVGVVGSHARVGSDVLTGQRGAAPGVHLVPPGDGAQARRDG